MSQSNPSQPAPSSGPVADPADSTDAAGPRILLVDDSATLRKLIASALRKFTPHVATVENGRRAIEAVHLAAEMGHPFDAIFMDVVMPEMNGYDATYQLRQEGYSGRIVILTANPEEFDMARNLCNGADDFLAKPFSPTDLKRTLIELQLISG